MIISRYKAPPEPPLQYCIGSEVPFEVRCIKTKDQGPIYDSSDIADSIEGSAEPIVLSRKSARELNKVRLTVGEFTEIMLEKFRSNSLIVNFINAQWCVFFGKWGASDSYKYDFHYKNREHPYYLKFFLCSEEYLEENPGKVLGVVSFHEKER